MVAQSSASESLKRKHDDQDDYDTLWPPGPAARSAPHELVLGSFKSDLDMNGDSEGRC